MPMNPVDLEEIRPQDIAFRGLAVRMTICTGHVDKSEMHPVSRRVEYSGEVVKVRRRSCICPHATNQKLPVGSL